MTKIIKKQQDKKWNDIIHEDAGIWLFNNPFSCYLVMVEIMDSILYLYGVSSTEYDNIHRSINEFSYWSLNNPKKENQNIILYADEFNEFYWVYTDENYIDNLITIKLEK